MMLDLNWKPPKINELPSWEHEQKVSIDTETCDKHLTRSKGSKNLGANARRDDNFVCGYSFAFEDGRSWYVPIAHEGGGNVDKEIALAYLKDQAKLFKGELVGMNLSYDLDFLICMGITFPHIQYYRDIANADPIICELHDSYSMKAIAQRHGCSEKDETTLNQVCEEMGYHPKSELWKLHAQHVEAYGKQDALLPLEILKKQEVLLKHFNLQEVFDLESEVLPVIMKMKDRGVLIDQNHLQKVEEYSIAQETEAIKEVNRLSGKQLGLGECMKPLKLDPIFKAIGITLPRTPTGLPSVKKDDVLNYDHPVANAVSWARRVNKLRTTFVESVKRHMTGGRLHCTFNQIARETSPGEQKGARFGRFSCSNPNLQQQPSRDEFASFWRKIYLPEPGSLWSCNDFSQQEPRWVTHFSATSDLRGAEEMLTEYNTNPKADNHAMMAKLTGLERDPAKAVFLGFCYGEGAVKFCMSQNLPTRWQVVLGRGSQEIIYEFDREPEALECIRQHGSHRHRYIRQVAGEEGQRIINRFNEKVPFVKELSNRVKTRAERDGFIKTVYGRRLNFPEKKDMSSPMSSLYDFTYRALNRLIQGSSGDQMKKAMVLLDRHLPEYYLQLTVHDETDGSIENVEVSKRAAEIMEQAIPSSVNFKVKVEVGPSWGEKELVES